MRGQAERGEEIGGGIVTITFFAPGEPVPQGSKKARVAAGRAIMWEANKRIGPWRQAVRSYAAQAMGNRPMLDAPIAVDLTFRFTRPAGHYRRLRYSDDSVVIRETSPTVKGSKPDLDKLIRACGDAMTGIVYTDDSRIVEVTARKLYVTAEHPQPGVTVTIAPAGGGNDA